MKPIISHEKHKVFIFFLHCTDFSCILTTTEYPEKYSSFFDVILPAGAGTFSDIFVVLLKHVQQLITNDLRPGPYMPPWVHRGARLVILKNGVI